MKTISLFAALALSIGGTGASADQLALNTPLAGATLQSAGVDMSVFWTEVDAGFEVVATYVEGGISQPNRMTMVLADGDDATFSLPGHSGRSYEFARTGESVTVTSIDNATLLASK